MAQGRFTTMVATDCNADCEDRFNEWYNNVHIPMMLKYPGLKKATRYKVIGDPVNGARYIGVYEYDSAESMTGINDSDVFKAAIQEMQESWAEGGMEIKWMANWEPIQTWEK